MVFICVHFCVEACFSLALRMFPFQQWIQSERTFDMDHVLARRAVIEDAPRVTHSSFLRGFLSWLRNGNAHGDTDFILEHMVDNEDAATE